MNRKIFFPIFVLIVAMFIHFSEKKSSKTIKNKKIPQNKNISKKLASNKTSIAPLKKKYFIKIIKHEIKEKGENVSIYVKINSNFPPETQLSCRFSYVNGLGEYALSERRYNLKKLTMQCGSFDRKKLSSGKYKVVVFYHSYDGVPSQIKNVPFTETTHSFSYGNKSSYQLIFETRRKKALSFFLTIKDLRNISRKKYKRIYKEAKLGKWYIWIDRWQKKFSNLQEKDRQFYQTSLLVPLFPSMRKSLGLLNILEDLATVDYTKSIEKQEALGEYREKRFDDLYYETFYQFQYESIAMSHDGKNDLIVAYGKFLDICIEEKKKIITQISPTIQHKEDFLLHIIALQKKYTFLENIKPEFFVKQSNQLLQEIRILTYQVKTRTDSIMLQDAFTLQIKLLKKWFLIAKNNKCDISSKYIDDNTQSFKQLQSDAIAKWKLDTLPHESIKKSIQELQSLLLDVKKIINKDSNLSFQVNNIIIWQSELAEKQQKNQKFLKIKENKKAKKIMITYTRIAMKTLIFLDEAKEIKQKEKLIKKINILLNELNHILK